MTHLKLNIYFVFNKYFFENHTVVEKRCRAGQATDDNMAHAHCMLGN